MARFDKQQVLGKGASSFPPMTAPNTHPTSIPTGLSISQLIGWLLCGKATQQKQNADYANNDCKSF
jgi:hypothetical protein